jgi:hypothetical protein
MINWLVKIFTKVNDVSVLGKWSTGWLNLKPKVFDANVFGRFSTGWSKQ